MTDEHRVQLHRLEGFFWVARTGGYAKAARAFPYPITQPAVHNQVKKLEDDLGVRLFERVAKDRMEPTASGRVLYDFVRPYFEALPAVIRSVQAGSFSGELRVASSSLLLRHLMPPWIRRLHDAHPTAQVHLQEETSDGAVALLRRGSVDLVVDHLYEVPDDLATMTVATLRAVVVVPESLESVNGLADLASTPFVAYAPGLRARELQFAALGMEDVSPDSLLSGWSAETIMGFVAAGLGWSILPWVDEEGPNVDGLRSFPLEPSKSDTNPTFEVFAAWRKDTPEHPLLDAMLELAGGS